MQSGAKQERIRMIEATKRVVVPPHVLIRYLDGESVLLNLESERYFGLDATGTRMWELVTTEPSIAGLASPAWLQPHVCLAKKEARPGHAARIRIRQRGGENQSHGSRRTPLFPGKIHLPRTIPHLLVPAAKTGDRHAIAHRRA